MKSKNFKVKVMYLLASKDLQYNLRLINYKDLKSKPLILYVKIFIFFPFK